MKRGEIWTVSGGVDYASKPRPAVVIQADPGDEPTSVTLCPLTSDPVGSSRFRVIIDPDTTNGLRVSSRLMADKITTVPIKKVGTRIGMLSPADLTRVGRALVAFLGLDD